MDSARKKETTSKYFLNKYVVPKLNLPSILTKATYNPNIKRHKNKELHFVSSDLVNIVFFNRKGRFFCFFFFLPALALVKTV